MKKKKLSFFMSLVMIASLTFPVFADNLVVDGDALIPVASNTLVLGSVELGASTTGNILLAISRNGSNENSFINGAVISVSFFSGNDTNISAAMSDSSIRMPMNWASLSNYSMTDDTAYSTVTLSVPMSATIGKHQANLYYRATGLSIKGEIISRDGSLAVNYNVIKATPLVTTWPSAFLSYGQNLIASSFSGGIASYNGVPVPGIFTFSNLPTTLLNAGTYDYDTIFTPNDTAKYNIISGKSHVTVNKANALISVSGFSGTYDGNEYGATGISKGINSEDLSGLLNLGQKFVDAPGGIASWTFTGNDNYNAASGTASITINKADAKISVNGYSGIYDGNPHGVTGTVIGVNNEDLTNFLDLGPRLTNSTEQTVSWTFKGNSNYNDQSGSSEINIAKCNAIIDIKGFTGVYDGKAHKAMGNVKGINGEDLSNLLHITGAYTNAPGGTSTWTFDGNENYNAASGTANIVINKAEAKITIDSYNGRYDGEEHGVIGSAVGVNNEDLSSNLNLGPKFINVPGGTVEWTFTGGTNYKDAGGTADIAITKAMPSITKGPTATNIILGQELVNSILSGGKASIPGKFSFNTPNTKPNLGTHSFEVTFIPNDIDNYHSITNNIDVTAMYQYSGVLQPINTDGSSLFKAGSTVPVKFTLRDVSGVYVTTANATITYAKYSNNICGTDVEAVSTNIATTGNAFRYDSTANQYIFNMSTKNMTAGAYKLTIMLDDGMSYTTQISLK